MDMAALMNRFVQSYEQAKVLRAEGRVLPDHPRDPGTQNEDEM
jgi:hypothetical protein